MKKEQLKEPDMLDEYDFRGGVRGKHYKEYMTGTNVVLLDEDVAKVFPDSDSVNQALRAMAQIIAEHRVRGTRRRSRTNN